MSENQNQESVRLLMEKVPNGLRNRVQPARAKLPTTETIEAELGLSLTGTCPSCGVAVDLLDDESTRQIVRAFIRSDKTSAVDGLFVSCPSCTADLTIDLVI